MHKEQEIQPRAKGGGVTEGNTSWLSVGLVSAAGLLRLLTPIPNCTPVGALGLYGGGRLRSWQAFALPIIVMLATDVIKIPILASRNLATFSWVTPWIYGSFLLNVLIGRWLCRTDSVLSIGLAGMLGSLQFFVLTNFGFWLTNQEVFFPYTLQGLLNCYVAALPFYSYGTLPGDLFYTGILFGGHALVVRWAAVPKARLAS